MQYHAMQCNTLAYSGILSHTLACSGILWHNQCIISNCWRSVPLPCGQYMAIFKKKPIELGVLNYFPLPKDCGTSKPRILASRIPSSSAHTPSFKTLKRSLTSPHVSSSQSSLKNGLQVDCIPLYTLDHHHLPRSACFLPSLLLLTTLFTLLLDARKQGGLLQYVSSRTIPSDGLLACDPYTLL